MIESTGTNKLSSTGVCSDTDIRQLGEARKSKKEAVCGVPKRKRLVEMLGWLILATRSEERSTVVDAVRLSEKLLGR